MKKFMLAIAVILASNLAFATDYFIAIDYVQRGSQIVKFSKPLEDGDRVILSFSTPANLAQPTHNGNVTFANQGEFTTTGNNQNSICLTLQGPGLKKTSCGNQSATVQFNEVGGLKPNTVYQAVYVTTGPAPDGIRVKLTPNTDRVK